MKRSPTLGGEKTVNLIFLNMCIQGCYKHTHVCFVISYPFNQHQLFGFMLLIATIQTWWKLFNDHLLGVFVPAKSLTLTSAPRLMSSLTCLASPRMAAMWRGVSPRSFLLLTLSFCRDEALLGTFFCTGVVCEGWLGVESGQRWAEKKGLNWCLKQNPFTGWDNYLP